MQVYDRSRAAHFDDTQKRARSSANILSRDRDAEEILRRLIAELDTQDFASATDRLEKGHGLRVVK